MKTTDKPQVKQYVIYSRKSKFTGKGESIENQIELCRQYIAMHFGEEAAENVLVYEDEGFSGGNLERPQFKKMMKDSQKIAFAAIVVYRLDRISRNIGDFAKLIEDLGDRHIDFISIREQFDTSSPMGRAMMYIASVFSQLERETIAERIRDNMHELSKTGRWLGGTTPTGYASESLSSVTVDGKVKKACKLKPIPEEIQLVKTIFEVFMETGSLSKTDQYLLEHRCVTKRGKQFTRFAIRGILTNPVYMIADETAYQYLKENNVDLFAERSEFDSEHGIMAYNRTIQRPGKANQIRPMEEWIVAVGKHPGIIAGSDWVRVQAMLDVNKSKSYRRPRSNVALLSGLLRCGECGDYMRPKLTNRKNADGELIYTYMCSTKERSHGTVCSMKNCNGNTLNAKIIEEIRKLSADKETLTRLLAQTKKVISGSKEGYDAELALLREKHTETEERSKRLVESLSVASDTSAKYVMEQIDALHQESETQQLRLAELEALTEQSRMLHQEFAFHQEMIESFASAVTGRFRNPYIKHQLLSIALNGMTKFRTRILPQLLAGQTATGQLPARLTFALAALIAFYRAERNGESYPVQDDARWLDRYQQLWAQHRDRQLSTRELVQSVLSARDHWEQDLTQVSGLVDQVTLDLDAILLKGMRAAVKPLC